MESSGLASLNRVDFGTFVWINVDSPSSDDLSHLSKLYPFHPLDIEDCLSKTQLPKIDEYPEYLFIILHFPRFRKEKKYSIPEQVSIFLGKDFLVTVHTGEIKPIKRLFQSFANSGESNGQCIIIESSCSSPPLLLYKLIHSCAENLMLMLGKVMFSIEQIEEKVFDEKMDAVREVAELRHNVANLRRIVFPLGRVVHDLEKKVQRFAERNVNLYFSDLSDYIDKTWAILEECKETTEIYKDSDFIISSDRTNKILTLLTIMFTFSIPFSVLGTLYGMNVHLPGGVEKPWTFLGAYTTFFVILVIALVPVMLMYVTFRKLRWR
ncbi:MAG: magnesium transporter CorA family protein [Nitrospirae bacterium]|nr:magnesium transporter CorA family protein [Nitrospirota bacterium]